MLMKSAGFVNHIGIDAASPAEFSRRRNLDRFASGKVTVVGIAIMGASHWVVLLSCFRESPIFQWLKAIDIL
jgi:hypothetical protein